MTLLISKTFERYTPDPEAHEDADFYEKYDEERGFEFEREAYTFTELVDLLKQAYHQPSTYPTVDRDTWVTEYESNTGTIEFYQQGIVENVSYHFHQDNSDHNARYWILALKAAGITR